MIRTDRERLQSKITEIWPDDVNGATLETTFDLEAELVANTVSQAILNPSKFHNLPYFIFPVL